MANEIGKGDKTNWRGRISVKKRVAIAVTVVIVGTLITYLAHGMGWYSGRLGTFISTPEFVFVAIVIPLVAALSIGYVVWPPVKHIA